ncbi:MAG: hypothetical protein U0Q15_03715 [Kineosporiaceae bacterium]
MPQFLRSPAALSFLAVTVGVGAYVVVPRLGSAYGDLGAGQPLRLSSATVVVGAGDTGTVTVAGELSGEGTPASTCVWVSYTGPDPASVLLAVDAGKRPPAVEVRLERSVARAGVTVPPANTGDCSGFTPDSTVYSGPLSGLAPAALKGRAAGAGQAGGTAEAARAGQGDQVPWTPSAAASVVYRLSFDRAAGADAVTPLSALLAWQAVGRSGRERPPAG